MLLNQNTAMATAKVSMLDLPSSELCDFGTRRYGRRAPLR
jgi:hypothetical protein